MIWKKLETINDIITCFKVDTSGYLQQYHVNFPPQQNEYTGIETKFRKDITWRIPSRFMVVIHSGDRERD